MRTIAVQIRTSCRKCGSPLPLNAMVPRLSCAACGGQNELDDAFWTSVLGEDDLSTSTVITDSREIALEVSRPKEPACAACGAGIPVDNALAAAEAGSIACPACAARTLLRVPPRHWVLSGFRLLVGEDELQLPAGGATVEAARASSPISFNCPTCGGVLQVDGTSRVVKCQYCSGSAYLPDDLWHVFHPVPVTRPWYLLHEPGARKRARHEAEAASTAPERLDELADHMDAEVRTAVACNPRASGATLRRLVDADESLATDALDNPALPAEMWSTLAASGSPWVLRKIADSAKAPPDALRIVAEQVAARLSDDWLGDEDVFDTSDVSDMLEGLAGNPGSSAEILEQVARLNRGRVPSDRADLDEALAQHAATPSALLAELARSDDDSVREAVAAHPRTAVEVLESLAGDAEWSVREAVAKRTELSPETLKRLGKDDDSSVREAARANPSYPRFSLFKSLFGG
ncbi:MAG TPA: HEAT repeat domain-containing protein [Longimicrobium sp.]|nr:HEAT repeat domain-containing protein [Longimicrobium sp.]